ncbi:MarR family transcriptional regulator [Haloarcula sp. Atlit-120R]|uniref:MarR family transcriptional regulator n=1 Tax=Haloarcula sp. Atlit-120R TaxID=2282135 RepID=UPI000EF243A8|nr:MarR family transcriptional regulator [Haloarcula sp. Atlit-120R]RLM32894.1 MarR family transcriptional regulator [Haloarcula sp. Atlit-120R]
MLTKASLALLDALSAGREATPDELATETEYSQDHIYDILDELLEDGLLTEARGSKNRRLVRVTDHPVVEAYRDLRSKLGHVDWTEILSPATLRVCWYLDEPRRVTEIAERLDITRQGVHNALSPLKHRAMLSPSGPEYALTNDLSPLLTFAREVVTHEHRSRARKLAPSATVEWCDPKRALVRVQTSEDTTALESAAEWRVTGLARFQEYGLQFFLAGEPAFWYAPDEDLTPSEVVCHTLVLDSGSRRVSYSMLLIEKLDIDQEPLIETATWYDLETAVAAMYRPLHGDFEVSEDLPIFLPSESEFSALKEQYGVS